MDGELASFVVAGSLHDKKKKEVQTGGRGGSPLRTPSTQEAVEEENNRKRKRLLSVIRHAASVEEYGIAERNPVATQEDYGCCGDLKYYYHWIPRKYNHMYIEPDSVWLKLWSCFILILLIYSCVVETFFGTFDHGHYIPKEAASMSRIVVMCIFLFDMLLECFTAFTANGFERVTSKKRMTSRYLWGETGSKFPFGFFWLDAISVMPWNLIGGSLHYPAIGRMLSLLKTLRIVRVQHTIHTLCSEWSTLMSGYVRLVQYFLFMFLISHFLACLFFVIPEVVAELTVGTGYEEELKTRSGATSWVDEQGIGNARHNVTGSVISGVSPLTQYIWSMYWAFTTMTTIGFGDVTPVSEPEVLVVILAELMGMIIFTFLLSNLATIFAFFSRQQTEATERADRLIDFMSLHNVPLDLRERIIKYVNNSAQSRQSRHELDESDENRLSLELRRQLRVSLKLPFLLNIYPFNSLSETVPTMRTAPALLKEIAYILTSDAKAPNDVIIKRRHFGEKLYIALRGVATVFTALGNVDTPQLNDMLKEPPYTGELEVRSSRFKGNHLRTSQWKTLAVRVQGGTLSFFTPDEIKQAKTKKMPNGKAHVAKALESVRLKLCDKVLIDRSAQIIEVELPQVTHYLRPTAKQRNLYAPDTRLEGVHRDDIDHDKPYLHAKGTPGYLLNEWYTCLSESMSGTRRKLSTLTDADARRFTTPDHLVKGIADELGLENARDIRIISICGSTELDNHHQPQDPANMSAQERKAFKISERICTDLGRKLAALDSHYVLLTGGFTGAGDTVARAFYEARIKKHEACVNTDADETATGLFHVLPYTDPDIESFVGKAPIVSEASGIKTFGSCEFGRTFHMGNSVAEREELMAVSPVIIPIEGGPGCANEISRAQANGKYVVPASVTGGAAAQMFLSDEDAFTLRTPPPGIDAKVWTKILSRHNYEVDDITDTMLECIQNIFEAKKVAFAEMQALEKLTGSSERRKDQEREWVSRDEHDSKILFPIHTINCDDIVKRITKTKSGGKNGKLLIRKPTPTDMKYSAVNPSVILGAGGAISESPLANLESHKRTVWVGRLAPRSAHKKYLKNYMSRFGHVESCFVRSKKEQGSLTQGGTGRHLDDQDWAMITYFKREDAYRCLGADLRALGNNASCKMAKKHVRAQLHDVSRWSHLEVRAMSYCELLWCDNKTLRKTIGQFEQSGREGSSLERMLQKCPEFKWHRPAKEKRGERIVHCDPPNVHKDMAELSSRVSTIESSVNNLESTMSAKMDAVCAHLDKLTTLMAGGAPPRRESNPRGRATTPVTSVSSQPEPESSFLLEPEPVVRVATTVEEEYDEREERQQLEEGAEGDDDDDEDDEDDQPPPLSSNAITPTRVERIGGSTPPRHRDLSNPASDQDSAPTVGGTVSKQWPNGNALPSHKTRY